MKNNSMWIIMLLPGLLGAVIANAQNSPGSSAEGNKTVTVALFPGLMKGEISYFSTDKSNFLQTNEDSKGAIEISVPQSIASIYIKRSYYDDKSVEVELTEQLPVYRANFSRIRIGSRKVEFILDSATWQRAGYVLPDKLNLSYQINSGIDVEDQRKTIDLKTVRNNPQLLQGSTSLHHGIWMAVPSFEGRELNYTIDFTVTKIQPNGPVRIGLENRLTGKLLLLFADNRTEVPPGLVSLQPLSEIGEVEVGEKIPYQKGLTVPVGTYRLYLSNEPLQKTIEIRDQPNIHEERISYDNDSAKLKIRLVDVPSRSRSGSLKVEATHGNNRTEQTRMNNNGTYDFDVKSGPVKITVSESSYSIQKTLNPRPYKTQEIEISLADLYKSRFKISLGAPPGTVVLRSKSGNDGEFTIGGDRFRPTSERNSLINRENFWEYEVTGIERGDWQITINPKDTDTRVPVIKDFTIRKPSGDVFKLDRDSFTTSQLLVKFTGWTEERIRLQCQLFRDGKRVEARPYVTRNSPELISARLEEGDYEVKLYLEGTINQENYLGNFAFTLKGGLEHTHNVVQSINDFINVDVWIVWDLNKKSDDVRVNYRGESGSGKTVIPVNKGAFSIMHQDQVFGLMRGNVKAGLASFDLSDRSGNRLIDQPRKFAKLMPGDKTYLIPLTKMAFEEAKKLLLDWAANPENRKDKLNELKYATLNRELIIPEIDLARESIRFELTNKNLRGGGVLQFKNLATNEEFKFEISDNTFSQRRDIPEGRYAMTFTPHNSVEFDGWYQQGPISSANNQIKIDTPRIKLRPQKGEDLYLETLDLKFLWVPPKGKVGGFWISADEVSMKQYTLITTDLANGSPKPMFARWTEARDCVQKLNSRFESDYVVRLPFEKEFEFLMDLYPPESTVNIWNKPKPGGILNTSTGQEALPKPVNLIGNMWEWCEDPWETEGRELDEMRNYYKTWRENPDERVYRGLAFTTQIKPDEDLQVLAEKARGKAVGNRRINNIGFRILLEKTGS